MKMRIVPEVADTAMQHAGADAINWQDANKSPQRIFRLGWPAMLDAAPSAGRVSREAVERVARALVRQDLARVPPRPETDAAAIDRVVDLTWDDWLPYARAAIAALGLEVEPDA